MTTRAFRKGSSRVVIEMEGYDSESGDSLPEEEDKVKSKRINWGKRHPEKIRKAVYDWDNECGDFLIAGSLKGEKNKTTMKMFALRVGIPIGTLEKYLHPNKAKRRVIGDGVGRKLLMNQKEYDFARQVAARKDRANNGMSRRDMIDLVQELHPELDRSAAYRQVSRHIIPKSINKGYIKRFVKAQPTTSDRTAITMEQQFRWHTLVEEQYNELRVRNQGVCKRTKKSFGELMPHFIWGLDEECICADHYGNVKIIGE